MNTTRIEWADVTWNPVTGCMPISAGCANCYARRMAARLRGRCGYPADDPFQVTVHRERFDQPFKLSRPSRVFVCSMGDLFHPDVPAEDIVHLFEIMSACRQHTFIVLTKRPERMVSVLFGEEGGWYLGSGDYIPNVWLGVTAEDQVSANVRIPVLLDTYTGTTFVSCEPLLGPVDLSPWMAHVEDIPRMEIVTQSMAHDAGMPEIAGTEIEWGTHTVSIDGLSWVIVGAETGPNARFMVPWWAREIRDQCANTSTPFFFEKMSRGVVTPPDLMVRQWPEGD